MRTGADEEQIVDLSWLVAAGVVAHRQSVPVIAGFFLLAHWSTIEVWNFTAGQTAMQYRQDNEQSPAKGHHLPAGRSLLPSALSFLLSLAPALGYQF